MVDWDRVEELRAKGWEWSRIAADARVGFHPDASVREPGRALRGLYHRQRSRRQRTEAPTPRKTKREAEERERRWSLARLGFLLTPAFGIWFALAYLIPSPVGLVLPAIPYLALALVVATFLLLFGLWRGSGPRWSKVARRTLVIGVVAGFVVSGMIALGGALSGCPTLPPAATLTTQSASGTGSGSAAIQPWISGHLSAWKDQGKPVIYFYGATWCPFCSAGSWAVYKALSEFGNVTGASGALAYSDPGDVYPSTPEVDLTALGYTSQWIAFQVSEYAGDPAGHSFPSTSNCYQSAYVTAYGQNSIPFLVVNGQYVHGGSQLIYPQDLAGFAGGGAATVLYQVQHENGTAWNAVQFQSMWVMAFLARSTGAPVATLSADLHWSTTVTNGVSSDLTQIR